MAALRFGDENFCRRLYDLGVKRGRGASEQPDLKDAQIEHIAQSKYGNGFTIYGPNATGWCVDLARASLSGLITEDMLTAIPQIAHIYIPLEYGATLIEATVQCMYWGSYSAEKEFQFKYGLDRSKTKHLESNVTRTSRPTRQPVVSFPPISASTIHNLALFHIQVYYFGKYLKYPFLIAAALNKLQENLLSPTDKVGITDFRELIELVWKPQEYESINAMLSDQKDDCDLRRILASFGAVWDPAWRANTRNIWEELTAPDGKYQNYAFWHMAAKRDIESSRPGRELAPRVKEAMPKDVKIEED